MIEEGHFVCLKEQELVEIQFQNQDETTWTWQDPSCEEASLLLQKEMDTLYLQSSYLQPQRQMLKWNHLYLMKCPTDTYCLFAIKEKVADRSFHAFALPQTGAVVVGRKQGDLCYDQPLLSLQHACFFQKDAHWWIKDLRSTNGVYVNHRRIEQKMLKVGDCIYFMGLQVLFGHGWIACNHLSSIRLSARLPPFEPASPKVIERTFSLQRAVQKDPFLPFVPPQYECKDPPTPQHRQQLPLLYQLGPALTMSIASFSSALLMVSIILSNDQPWIQALPSLIMAVSMLLGSLVWPLLSRRYEQHQSEQVEEKRCQFYRRYLKRQRQILQQYLQEYQNWLWNFMYTGTYIWQKELPQDCLILALGIADQKTNSPYLLKEVSFEKQEDILSKEKQAFLEQECILSQVPLLQWITQVQLYCVIGTQEEQLAYAKYLLYHHITMYEPNQNSLMFAYRQDQNLQLPHFLPHLFDEEGHRLLCRNASEIAVLWMHIRKAHKPTLIFSFANEFTSFIIHNLGDFPIALFAFHPVKETFTKIQLQANQGTLLDEKQAFSWKNSPREQMIFDEISNFHWSQSQEQFPDCVGFLELFQRKQVNASFIWDQWQKRDSEFSLKAALGVGIDGSVIELDLHERAHGPHGIVAGMTGSGKSELLITMLLSLAISYHPYDCAFLLIDYKGGGMAKTLEQLPHTAGIITNLDGSSIQRSLYSLDAELIRRQTIFAETMKIVGSESMNIDMYQKYYHDHLVSAWIPHLVIVADEFAELKQQEPQFMEQLIRIARIGRSLGIHLILATQKPSGIVDDQIWSNARFHLCLKVADKTDSMDMLKKEDGAKIKAVGRFYLQVGYDELFLQGQSAYAKSIYDPFGNRKKQTIIQQMGTDGRILRKWQRPAPEIETFSELQVLLKIMQDLKEAHGLERIQVWQAELPASLKGQQAKQDAIALIDDPMHQRQLPLYLHQTYHNTLLYAQELPATKEVFHQIIKAMEVAFPDARIVILDGDQGDLCVYQEASRVYAALSLDQEEDIEFLMAELLEHRKHGFSTPWLLMVHNVAALIEQNDSMEQWLLTLAKDHGRKGITLMMSATSLRDVPSRLAQQFETLFVFHLHDDMDAHALIPGDWRISHYPLRAIWYDQRQSYEVQFYQQNAPWMGEKKPMSKLACLPVHVHLAHVLLHPDGFPLGISLETRKQIDLPLQGIWILTGKELGTCLQDLKQIQQQFLYNCQIVELPTYPCAKMQLCCIPIDQLQQHLQTPWYKEAEQQNHLFWLGKGIEEHRYLWNISNHQKIHQPQDLLWLGKEKRIRRIEMT